MSKPLEDREPFPDAEDPANDADAMGEGINPEEYFAELQSFLEQTAEEATAEDDVDDEPEVEPEEVQG